MRQIYETPHDDTPPTYFWPPQRTRQKRASLYNRLDVRIEYAAYKRKQLSNKGFLMSLTASIRAYDGELVKVHERYVFADTLHRLPCNSDENMVLAIETLVRWCDQHQIVLVDL